MRGRAWFDEHIGAQAALDALSHDDLVNKVVVASVMYQRLRASLEAERTRRVQLEGALEEIATYRSGNPTPRVIAEAALTEQTPTSQPRTQDEYNRAVEETMVRSRFPARGDKEAQG